MRADICAVQDQKDFIQILHEKVIADENEKAVEASKKLVEFLQSHIECQSKNPYGGQGIKAKNDD